MFASEFVGMILYTKDMEYTYSGWSSNINIGRYFGLGGPLGKWNVVFVNK